MKRRRWRKGVLWGECTLCVGFMLLLAMCASYRKTGFWEGAKSPFPEWAEVAGIVGGTAIAAGLAICCLGGMVLSRPGTKSPKPWHCPCGCDLWGNESETCPECGRRVRTPPPSGEGVVSRVQRIADFRDESPPGRGGE